MKGDISLDAETARPNSSCLHTTVLTTIYPTAQSTPHYHRLQTIHSILLIPSLSLTYVHHLPSPITKIPHPLIPPLPCAHHTPISTLHMHPRNNKAPTNATKPPTSHAQLSRSLLCFCGIMHSEPMLRSIQGPSLRWRAVNDTRVGHGECLFFVWRWHCICAIVVRRP
jgi:hypothetical protein